MSRRDFFHALQRLDPALCLFGFGGLGLESGDELLQMGNFPLLFFKSRLLIGNARRPLNIENGIDAAVRIELLVL